jgi:protein O-GlcNAc transferase
VLWLFRANAWAEGNLRKEAQKRGVDASRLVFAEPTAHATHLARQQRADLFLAFLPALHLLLQVAQYTS